MITYTFVFKARWEINQTGPSNSLNAKIAAGQRGALMNALDAQTGKAIDETRAYDLIAAAT